MGLRELLGNDISGLDFNSDLTQVEPWASYIYNHVDLPRMRQGGMGGQVTWQWFNSAGSVFVKLWPLLTVLVLICQLPVCPQGRRSAVHGAE